MSDIHATIKNAFVEAQARRPYKADPAIIEALIPPGGDWECAHENFITRIVVWGRMEVAIVNAAGDLDDVTEGNIAMAIRSLPAMDAALRSIMVLAEKPENAPLIRRIAAATIEYFEMPAPALKIRDDDEDAPNPTDGDQE